MVTQVIPKDVAVQSLVSFAHVDILNNAWCMELLDLLIYTRPPYEVSSKLPLQDVQHEAPPRLEFAT